MIYWNELIAGAWPPLLARLHLLHCDLVRSRSHCCTTCHCWVKPKSNYGNYGNLNGQIKKLKKETHQKIKFFHIFAAALIAAPRVIVEWSFSLILLLKPNYIVHTIGVSEKAGKPIFCIISLKKLSLFFSSAVHNLIMET